MNDENSEAYDVASIALILLKKPFCTLNVLGKAARADAERMVKANFCGVDQKRIKIRVHK